MSTELAEEIYSAARQALDAGHYRAAVLLAWHGLEASGRSDPAIEKLAQAALAGWTIAPEDAAKAVEKLAETVALEEQVIEIPLHKALAIAAAIAMIAVAFTSLLPPWAEALLIPAGAAIAAAAGLRG